MKKYVIKTFALLMVSALGFIFILSPMMSSAKDYGPLKKTKTVSDVNLSSKITLAATYHGDGNSRWTIVTDSYTISGIGATSYVVNKSELDADQTAAGYKVTTKASMSYYYMYKPFTTNSALYTWEYVESTKTLR